MYELKVGIFMEETDMLKIFEQAAAMSKMMNPDSESAKAQGEWLEKMTAMIEVVKLMKAMQPPQALSKVRAPFEVKAPRQEQPDPDFYDAPIHTPALRTIKAAIPHLDYRYQKNLGVMVKLIEIQRLLEMYNERIVASECQGGNNWRRDMLQAIHPHVPEEKQNMLELLIKMIDIKEILENMQRMRGNNPKEVGYGL